MKKILPILIFMSCIFLSGCNKLSKEDIIKKLDDKISKADSYYVEGEMEILNNEDLYTYDIKVAYSKKDNYKVELVNTTNNHEQVILRNEDGVYVITPSLNKSFKFQSDWPYNNSQIYLLSSLLDDLSSDNKYTFEQKDNGYVYTTKVNYPNNKNLVKQMIYLNNKLNVTEVRVLDEDNNTQIKMVYKKIKYNKNFDKDYFKLSNIVKINEDNTDNNTKKDNSNTTNDSYINENSTSNNETSEDNITKETAVIEDIIYPMYLPTNTYLQDQEKVDTESGERMILTFAGDNPFTLVEETVKYSNSHEIIPTYGDLELMADAVAVVNDNSVNWISNGIEYYVVSDTMETAEILQVARSISVLPVSK